MKLGAFAPAGDARRASLGDRVNGRMITLVAVGALALSAASAACSAATKPDLVPGANGSDAGAGGDNGGSGDQTPPDPPHALGAIVLGEAHAAGSASSTPIVSAGFVPDASAKHATCTRAIDGCEALVLPTGCNCASDETCSLDNACKPACVKACTASCSTDEECYFPSPNSPACRKRETFNAGALAFAGTTTPITLFPPYSFDPADMHGAPFLAGAKIEVQASGATEAGFDKFDETFTATTFLQTKPSLDKIALAAVFGTGSIPIGWVPGTDQIVITVGGPGGSATCKAADSAGHFDLPRSVIKLVSGDTGGTPSLSLSVSRQRTETHKGLKTKGAMTTATVQPVGFVAMTTSSSESTTFEGCSGGETMCGDTCADTLNSSSDCGSCGHACTGNGYCLNGKCSNETSGGDAGGGGTSCQTCVSGAASGSCKSTYDACNANADCAAYQSCAKACASGDTTCVSNCQSAHASGASAFSNFANCVCSTACTTECTTECGN